MTSRAIDGGAIRQSKFELAVALTLFTWSALTLAVQESWGGPDSAEKREWFAGAIVELFPSLSTPSSQHPAGFTSMRHQQQTPNPDTEDVEERILQVMEDEFEVVVDDGSPATVAASIMLLYTECEKGDFTTVDQLNSKFQRQGAEKVVGSRVGAGSDDEDSVDEESDEEGEDSDVEMGDAPTAVVPRKEKPVPEVDEDGFTKVVGRKGKVR